MNGENTLRAAVVMLHCGVPSASELRELVELCDFENVPEHARGGFDRLCGICDAFRSDDENMIGEALKRFGHIESKTAAIEFVDFAIENESKYHYGELFDYFRIPPFDIIPAKTNGELSSMAAKTTLERIGGLKERPMNDHCVEGMAQFKYSWPSYEMALPFVIAGLIEQLCCDGMDSREVLEEIEFLQILKELKHRTAQVYVSVGDVSDFVAGGEENCRKYLYENYNPNADILGAYGMLVKDFC